MFNDFNIFVSQYKQCRANKWVRVTFYCSRKRTQVNSNMEQVKLIDFPLLPQRQVYLLTGNMIESNIPLEGDTITSIISIHISCLPSNYNTNSSVKLLLTNVTGFYCIEALT